MCSFGGCTAYPLTFLYSYQATGMFWHAELCIGFANACNLTESQTGGKSNVAKQNTCSDCFDRLNCLMECSVRNKPWKHMKTQTHPCSLRPEHWNMSDPTKTVILWPCVQFLILLVLSLRHVLEGETNQLYHSKTGRACDCEWDYWLLTCHKSCETKMYQRDGYHSSEANSNWNGTRKA